MCNSSESQILEQITSPIIANTVGKLTTTARQKVLHLGLINSLFQVACNHILFINFTKHLISYQSLLSVDPRWAESMFPSWGWDLELGRSQFIVPGLTVLQSTTLLLTPPLWLSPGLTSPLALERKDLQGSGCVGVLVFMSMVVIPWVIMYVLMGGVEMVQSSAFSLNFLHARQVHVQPRCQK